MQTAAASRARRALAALALGLGVALAAAALTADVVGVGRPGLGKGQLLAALAGAALAAAGVVLCPARRRRAAAALGAAPRLRPLDAVLLAAWIGVLAGLAELAHLGVQKLGGVVLKQPAEIVWMLPATYLLAYGACGVLLAVVAAVAPRAVRAPFVVFVLAAPAAFGHFTLHPAVDAGAAILLSVGIAAQLARLSLARAEGLRRLARRTLPWLAAVLVGLGLGMPLLRDAAEARTHAGLPAAAPGAPNVLLIVLDTVRADHLGAYGYARPTTPEIDVVAAEGALFEWPISTSPWTLPSHASMFTGRYPHELSTDWLTPLDDEPRTLAEELQARGYATAGFVGNINYCCRDQGLDRGFAHYRDYWVTPAVMLHTTSLGRRFVGGLNFFTLIRNDARRITETFLDWQEARQGRPFFAFLNYFDAHGLFHAPEEFAGAFGEPSELVDEWYLRRQFTPDEMQGFVDAYDACLRSIDHSLGALFAELRARGALDDTLVVITADHGEQFGEHGLRDHSNSLYKQLLHVPLILRFPARVPAGRRIQEHVSLRDLPATILDLIDAGHALPGQSLAVLWQAPPAESAEPPPPLSALLSSVSAAIRRPAYEPISKGPMKSLVDAGGRHLILNGDGVKELYDLSVDPAEERDLIDTLPAIAQELLGRLMRLVSAKR